MLRFGCTRRFDTARRLPRTQMCSADCACTQADDFIVSADKQIRVQIGPALPSPPLPSASLHDNKLGLLIRTFPRELTAV